MVKQRYDFVASEKFSKEDVKRVQETLLSMAKIVLGILELHEIKYMMAYGTLLGAVRHKGFIPWDDDFDIFIFEEDYEKALYWLRKELPSSLIVHDEKTDEIYWPYWSRVRDLNTEIVLENVYTDDKHYKYRGLSLDMYKLKKCLKKEADLSIYKENILFYQKKFERGFISKEVFEIKTNEVATKIQKEEETIANNDNKEEMYYFVAYNTKIEIDNIFPLRKYKFENEEFYGPNDAAPILTQVYGDYMEVPPLEKRVPHASYVKFLTENMQGE